MPQSPFPISPKLPEALKRTFAFFEQNPDRHYATIMSDAPNGNPFHPRAQCFCFGGRLAVELGQLPPEIRAVREEEGGYSPGYDELTYAGVDYGTVYAINDKADTLADVLREERAMFEVDYEISL